ncbi:MAG TPA: GntR family transcriptional regulator, partial [Firmicutes bacterium]|nr:GntR family transcriptional regulator [Bacillota bacterium]
MLPISLSSSSDQPYYRQIVEQIRHLILSGRLKPGTQLPSVRQLASDLTVSVITTRRAYEELEREELIVTRPGTGSIVAEGGTGGHDA